MAAGGDQGVPQLGGYDYEFVSEVPDKWMCLICQLPLKDPMQIMGCGHRLCQICIDEVMRRPRAACPADRTPISRDQVFPDVGCEREIQDLRVKCPFEDCSWTGELRAVEGSDAHETNCPDGQAPCGYAGCEEKIKRKDLPTHMYNTCKWRIVDCEYCHDNLPRLILPVHLEKCKRYPLTCENECGMKAIPREKMKTHLSINCPLTVITCNYKNLGCDAKAQRRQMEEHMDSAVKHHLELACTKIEQQEATSKEQEKKITEQGKTLERMHLEFCKMKEEAERSIATLMDRFSQKRTNEIFKWKPGEIDYRSSVRKVVSSDSFYLRGYKMVLFLEPLKSRFDRNAPVSVGLHIITGKFDNEVEWPLTRKLQVKITKQNGASEKTYILQKDQPIPRPYPNEEITISVTTDENTIRSALLTVTFW